MLDDFVSLIYPNVCSGCSRPLLKHENTICLHCKTKLPFTHFHDDPHNMIEKIFWGRVPVEAASCLAYFYKRGLIQNMMHQLKYKDRTEVGVDLGKIAGFQLANSKRFSGVDLVIPIPMHPRKRKKRGYNQCTFIAKGIAEPLNAGVNEVALTKTDDTASQTRKSKFNRWLNVKSVFNLERPQDIEGKRVLLIDDVVTTGATLEAAGQTLLQAKNVELNIFTIAHARK
ncbi:ComF family protein [Salibacter halophilus]|uniref:ComF family protein n=2 Tax=Salibacter halophilus TaxID=1803916 RepID=A0A6N6MAE2_9FLAO|nr:ComF family protein [Salibacter halophilus]